MIDPDTSEAWKQEPSYAVQGRSSSRSEPGPTGINQPAPGAPPRCHDGCDKIPAALQHNCVEMKLKIRTCPTSRNTTLSQAHSKALGRLMVRFDALTL